MCTSAIELLVKQALRTFSRNLPAPALGAEENFLTLKRLADKITADDVNLDESLAGINPCSKAPVHFIEIYEDKDITIGIFIVKPGMRLPLHDHPQMRGILRVLTGKISVQSYSLVDPCTKDFIDSKNLFSRSGNENILAEKHNEQIVGPHDEACFLNSMERNLHEVQHKEGNVAAFLDVLSPPYPDTSSNKNQVDDALKCHYFKEIGEELSKEKKWSYLKEIQCPDSFWCDSSIPYTGPSIARS